MTDKPCKKPTCFGCYSLAVMTHHDADDSWKCYLCGSTYKRPEGQGAWVVFDDGSSTKLPDGWESLDHKAFNALVMKQVRGS